MQEDYAARSAGLQTLQGEDMSVKGISDIPTARLRKALHSVYTDKRTKGVVYAELLKRKHKRTKR